MITKITNEMGVISLDELLISDILTEAIKPWEGKAHYTGNREMRYTEKGMYINVSLSIRMGNSIGEICSGIIDTTADMILNSLQLDIEDIVVNVIEMTTLKTSVKRDIRKSYREPEIKEQGK